MALIRTVAVLAAVVCGPAFPAGARAQDMPVVKDIEVQGLRRIDIDVVGGRISQPLGAPLAPETVSEDIKAVFDLGYFSDVTVEVEPFDGGVRLIYVLKEKQSIRGVEVSGNEELEDDVLMERVGISPGSLSDVVLIQNNAGNLRALYQEKGYPLARVVPVVRELDEGHVLLTYEIEEGPKVKIGEIEIEGNEEISDWTVKRAMETAEWHIFSWLTGGGHYEKETLEEDRSRILARYHDDGFIRVQVQEPRIELSENRKWMDITVEVAEGEQFRISSISFSGNKVFTDEELSRDLLSRPGALVSKKGFDRDVASLTERYGEKGYALAAVLPDIDPDLEAHTAAVTFRIHEGDIYRVGRIEISGNQQTRDKVIRREMRLNEGETYNSKLLKRSYQRINNLNFFEQVSVKPQPDRESKTLDLKVEVAERSTGYLNVGVGYSSVDRFIGLVELTQANLGGSGQYAKLKSEFGSRSTTYELAYRAPWVLDTEMTFDAKLYNTERDFVEYFKRATGFEVGLRRGFWEYWHWSVSYGFEKATIFDLDDNASDFIRDQEGTSRTSAVSVGIARDTRDNFLNPHSGTRHSAAVSYAGLGGDNNFYKVSLDATYVLPVTRRTHFSFRARHSFAHGVSGEELPVFERYHVGGGSSVRGHRNLGPQDENGNYIGGEKLVIFNADYIFPLIEEAGIQGEIFYDLGAAYDSSIDLADSTGAGVRWMSPIGPIKIDWAYIIEPRGEEPSSRWEFILGTFF